MKNVFMVMFCFLFLPSLIKAQNGLSEYDPFRGNYSLGKKGEIISYCSFLSNDTCRQTIFDYNVSAQELDSLFSNYECDDNGIRGSKDIDLIIGNFNSDLYDDVAVAWEGPDQSLLLMIPHIDTLTLGCSDKYVSKTDTMILCSGSHTKIRLAVGNFDLDPDDEFILAYLDKEDKINILLYDTNSGLVPSVRCMITDHLLDTGMDFPARFDIAAGEFDGDGVDELIFVCVQPPESNWSICCTIYDYDYESDEFVKKIAGGKAFLKPSVNNYDMDRLSIAAGDIDGDNLDEAVLGFELAQASIRYNIFFFRWECSHMIYAGIRTLQISPNLDDIEYGNIFETAANYLTNYVSYNSSQDPPDPFSERTRPIEVISTDFNLDNRDEIVFAAYDKIWIFEEFSDSTGSKLRSIDQLPYSPKLGDKNNHVVHSIDLDADTTTIYWTPELLVSDFSGSSKAQKRIYTPVIDDSLRFQGMELITTVESDFSNVQTYAFAGGDFDGDGIHLGSPKRYSKTDLVQPIVILNAPPVHFDVFNDTLFDVNMSYNENQSQFWANYQTEAGEDKEVQTEVNRDWGISANFSAEASFMGVGVKASLSARYGEGFSKMEGSTESVTIMISADAIEDDRIYAIVTDYDIWEYPLFSGRQKRGNVLVVSPKITENRWFPSKSWSGSRYVPNHEVGNILSYEAYASLVENDDMAQWVTGTYSNDNSFVLDANSSYDWSLNIEKFDESGADKSREIGVEVGTKVSGYGLEVGIEANYTQDEMQTLRTTVSDLLSIQVHLDAIDMGLGEMGYVVTPYSYWAKNGALVLDYAVRPELSEPGYTPTWWQSRYGTQPDPAFILPWRYDPEKGFALEEEAKRYQTKEIQFKPENPEPGDEITIYARIHNYSLVPTQQPVVIQFYIGDPDHGGTLIVGKSGQTQLWTGSSISARGKATLSMDWVIPEDVPYYPRIFALIDPYDDITEINDGNNKGFTVLPVEGVIKIEAVSEIKSPQLYSLEQNLFPDRNAMVR